MPATASWTQIPWHAMNDPLQMTYKLARRIAIATIGGTILVIGIVMLVAPGPAVLVIPLGLGVLAAEFAWARNWLSKLRRGLSAGTAKERAERAEQHRRRHRI